MIFICERTSTYGDEKPCKQAYEMEVEYKMFPRREEPRNITKTKWVVWFDNLGALMEFMAEHDRVVLGDTSDFILNSVYLPYIEIYDDYRE